MKTSNMSILTSTNTNFKNVDAMAKTSPFFNVSKRRKSR